jgi:hypothetical protein
VNWFIDSLVRENNRTALTDGLNGKQDLNFKEGK